MNQMSFLACTWRLGYVSKIGPYFEDIVHKEDIVHEFCPLQNPV